jgi:hypothetical protein
VRGRSIVLGVLGVGLAVTLARAGHESPFYPSFYPQEIRIEVVDPPSASTRLRKASLHAYAGPAPLSPGPTPTNLQGSEFLGAYLVLTFKPGSVPPMNREERCALAREVLDRLGREPAAFVFHPYPMTPYHHDYLHHFDLSASLRSMTVHVPSAARPATAASLRLRANGPLAEALARSQWRLAENDWDATLEEVDVAALMAPHVIALNGWLGPPWLKDGWFHAYLLLAGTVSGDAAKRNAAGLYRRLVTGGYTGAVDRLNLERRLVSVLTGGCERVVVGYTLKRAYANADYSAGVENIAHDSQSGFASPMFFRTVKLKDFPWNGWLTLGTPSKPAAAWNPLGGFTDPAGRLVWFAVGDPPFLPAPFQGSWIPNRVIPDVATPKPGAPPIEVPPDALIPTRGTGILREVGPGQFATAKVTYRIRMSAFHDGSQMSVPDAFYPFVVAYRWGVEASGPGATFDPSIAGASALVRERLQGLKVLRVEQEEERIADIQLVRQVPVIEVYLRSTGADVAELVAPPWSTVPWHLLALMEEAVGRGIGAFSSGEAARRGVAWLDLARDRSVRARLASLLEEFERTAYLPAALKGLATAEEARERWAALRRFGQAHGHFLVANGPYRLDKVTADAVVLQAFRDNTYPLGVGSFDRYALPPRARIAAVEARPDGLRISGEIDNVIRAQRSYTTARESLTRNSTTRGFLVEPLCSYLVVEARGAVVRASAVPISADGSFSIDLGGLKPGQYTVLAAIFANGNAVNPEVKTVEYPVGRER